MKKPLIVITGASSGFGLAAAKQFAADGYPLLLLARNIKPISELDLPNAMLRSVDVTDINAFEKAYADAKSQFGPADLLINSAGVMLLGKIAEQDVTQWSTMLDVNVKGMLNGIKTVLSDMIENKTGSIINISSIAGRKTFENHAAYVATKFAVHGLSENLREELASQNIRVITISPGAAQTNLLSHTKSQQIKDNYERWKQEIGGVLCAQDIANAIWFAYKQPQNVCIREIVLAATAQVQ